MKGRRPALCILKNNGSGLCAIILLDKQDNSIFFYNN